MPVGPRLVLKKPSRNLRSQAIQAIQRMLLGIVEQCRFQAVRHPARQQANEFAVDLVKGGRARLAGGEAECRVRLLFDLHGDAQVALHWQARRCGMRRDVRRSKLVDAQHIIDLQRLAAQGGFEGQRLAWCQLELRRGAVAGQDLEVACTQLVDEAQWQFEEASTQLQGAL